ncbi:hypothetical protein OG474_30190 [Kribbella sp. NBC_01505]|uniref:hypothetical protein n=1 Tax=Kribbella sp. NBC_01505 TaxID=2903580 RepID=UPI003870D0ED
MRIENDDEAQATQHIVLDNPEDQVYVTHNGMTLSISLGDVEPERVFQPYPIELDIMTEDDLVLDYPTGTESGDGLRIRINGEFPFVRFDRTYTKEA